MDTYDIINGVICGNHSFLIIYVYYNIFYMYNIVRMEVYL